MQTDILVRTTETVASGLPYLTLWVAFQKRKEVAEVYNDRTGGSLPEWWS